MKKNIILLIALFTLFVPSAFAFDASSSATAGFLTLTSGGMTPSIAPIGLSPKVEAYYVTDGTSDVTAQWYAIATVHPGGNLSYGTAQDLNNIYHSTYETGSDTATELEGIPATSASASVWKVWGDI